MEIQDMINKIKLQFSREGLTRLLSGIKSGTLKRETAVVPAGPQTVFACDYGSSRIIMTEVSKQPGKVRLEQFLVIPRPSEAGKAPAVMKEAVTGRFQSSRVRVSVKGQSVIVRFIQFPKMSIEELKSAITYEAENYIPFKIDEVLMDFTIVRDEIAGEAGKMEVLLIAVKKEEIYPLIKDFQDADLQVELIDIDILASVNALEYFYPEEFQSSIAFLDVGKEISSVSVICEGKPCFIRDISYGGLDVAKRLRRKLGLGLEDAQKILDGEMAPTDEAQAVLTEAYETLCSDLKVTLDYYIGQVNHSRPVEKVFIAGGGNMAGLISKVLGKNLKLEVTAVDISGKIELSENIDKELVQKSQGMLPVALGLCLRNA